MSDVDEWLRDLEKPAPNAIDLAIHVVANARGEGDVQVRDSLIRLAQLVVNIDNLLKGCREACFDLRKEKDFLIDRLRVLSESARSSAYTSMVAISRLQEQEQLVKEAISWEEDKGAHSTALRQAVKEYLQVLRKRS